MDDTYKGILWDMEESPYFKGEIMRTDNVAEFDKVEYAISGEQQSCLEKDFVYHPPRANQIPRYNLIRDEARKFAQLLMNNCPPSRELSLALTHLEEAVMQANASIARNE